MGSVLGVIHGVLLNKYVPRHLGILALSDDSVLQTVIARSSRVSVETLDWLAYSSGDVDVLKGVAANNETGVETLLRLIQSQESEVRLLATETVRRKYLPALSVLCRTPEEVTQVALGKDILKLFSTSSH